MSDPDRAEPAEDDEAALRWEGDDELGRMTSLDEPRLDAPATEAAPPGEQVVAEPPAAAAGPRDVLLTLVSAGFAGVFLAEMVGWILVVQAVQAGDALTTGSGVLDFIGGITRFLALVAGGLWFVATIQLTRDTRRRRRLARIGWLALGSGLLAPWPLLLGFLR
ncbi:MAG: hypothetical protein HY996_09750 [Micrococcales bacterium]|nr:hypothetical protein [Micrococcales bacterium]